MLQKRRPSFEILGDFSADDSKISYLGNHENGHLA